VSHKFPIYEVQSNTAEPTLPVERISVVVVAGRELDEDVGRTGLDFVELERRHVAPDAEPSEDGVTSVVGVQIGREVENPGRK